VDGKRRTSIVLDELPKRCLCGDTVCHNLCGSYFNFIVAWNSPVMSWIIAVAWILCGVATWDRHDRYLARIGKINSALERDLAYLVLMMIGPVIFFLCLMVPERKDGP
jgi:hypothetical protein